MLQVPTVQTFLAKKVLEKISQDIRYKIELDKVRVAWFDEAELKGLAVYDQYDSLMLFCEDLYIDINLFEAIKNTNVLIDAIEFRNPIINIRKYQEQGGYNVLNLLSTFEGDTVHVEESKKEYELDRLIIDQGKISIHDPWLEGPESLIPLKDLTLESLNLELKSVFVGHSKVDFLLDNFSFVELTSGFQLDRVHSKITVVDQEIGLTDFELLTPNTSISNEVFLRFPETKNLAFQDVFFEVDLVNSVFSTEDVRKLMPNFKLDDDFLITGQIEGTLNDVQLRLDRMEFGEYSYVSGFFSIDGLPEVWESFFDVKLNESLLHPSDIARYFHKDIVDRLVKIGDVHYSGELIGFLSDFVARGNVILDAGEVEADLNMKLNENPILSKYSGKVELKDLDMSKVLDQDFVKHIYLKGRVFGQGISFNTADFLLDAQVDTFETATYTFNHISTRGQFNKNSFIGQVGIKDENIHMNGRANIKLAPEKYKIFFQGNIDSVKLHEIVELPKKIKIQSDLAIDISSTSPKNLVGELSVSDFSLISDSLQHRTENFLIEFDINDRYKEITVSEDNLKLTLNGDFDPYEIKDQLIEHVDSLLEIKDIEHQLVRNILRGQKIDLRTSASDLNDWLKVLYPKLKLPKKFNTVFKVNEERENFSYFQTDLEYVEYDGTEFFSTEIRTKFLEDSGFVNIRADSIKHGGNTFEDVGLLLHLVGDTVDFSFYGQQRGLDNSLKIIGIIDQNDTISQMTFVNSSFRLLGDDWKIINGAKIRFNEQHFDVRKLYMVSAKGQIVADGRLSNNQSDSLKFSLRKVNLNEFFQKSSYRLKGLLDGYINIRVVDGKPILDGNVNSDDFSFNGIDLGRLSCVGRWNSDEEKLAIKLAIEEPYVSDIKLAGYIYPLRSTDMFDLELDFKEFGVKLIAPFVKEYGDQLSGTMTGALKIEGGAQSPRVIGRTTLNQAGIRVKYLGCRYEFLGDIDFNEYGITLDNIQLIDEYKNTGYLSGGVKLETGDGMSMDVGLKSKDFMALNINSIDNDFFYGSAFVGGELRAYGDMRKVTISANMKTNKGTKLYLPISDESSYEQLDFITFLPPGDSVKLDNITKKVDFGGLDLDLNLEVTPDAYFELIFDIKAGDIIRGRGVGNFDMQMTNQGDFNMFGDFMITEGGYNFTMYNIINKEFEIQNGSRLSWSGDPYKATIDISAIYNQKASLTELVKEFVAPDDQEKVEQDAIVGAKYPAQVGLGLKGNMMSPEIDFSIDITNYPESAVIQGTGNSLKTYVDVFKSKLDNDEQELKRQVFSLIVLKKFSPPNTLSVERNSVNSSVSEFVSNQLSYWISQVDENLEIDVDLNSLDADALNTLQLRLAYTMFDGRLRVTRGGGVRNQSQDQNQAQNVDEESSNLMNVLGNWSVEYLLTPDGKLRAKLYTRSNTGYSLNYGQNQQTGFSLQYVKSFDQLKEIISLAKKEKN